MHFVRCIASNLYGTTESAVLNYITLPIYGRLGMFNIRHSHIIVNKQSASNSHLIFLLATKNLGTFLCNK